MGHFGVTNTLDVLRKRFLWPRMLVVVTCVTYHMAKGFFNMGWVLKITHIVTYHRMGVVSMIAKLYFAEVKQLH